MRLRVTLYLTALLSLLVGAQFALQGCSSCQDNQYEKLMTSSMPTGVVETGEVVLDSFEIAFDLPTNVFAQLQKGQWLANAEYGTFRVTAAQIADSSDEKSTANFVRNRLTQLVSVREQPEQVASTMLKRAKAESGHIITYQQVKGNDSRTYVVVALKYDTHILVLSFDAYDQAFQNPEMMTQHLIQSIHKPGDQATEAL